KYANIRTASLAAAVELYGAGSPECAATKAAWSAVAVPAQSGEASCTATSNDFSLSLNPSAGTVTPGQSATSTVGTQTTSGSAQTVTLSASGLPSGATASFSPSSVTSGNSSTLTISTSASTPAGTYPITVNGSAASGSHTATFTLTVGGGTGQDFSISASPASGTVSPGGAATSTISTATTSGSAQTVSLSATGLPTGATAGFNPATVTSGGSSTLTIATTASTPAGTYAVTVKGTGQTTSHTTTYTLTVQGSSTERTFRNDTNYTIDDYSTITSPVTSTATGTAVSPVKLTITISHTCAEDLSIRLKGPNGTWYRVVNSGGSTCTSFGTRTYSVPVTQQAAGTWTLEVTDNYWFDTGYLDWWSITV
ncbi:proprotein convertase P-domain-containing protein, partial [Sphaerisporangium fuscum]|uniref:proprotein convertase P-domain-containing protein n=1 Tax=Sphaerisporangium fuscum TaxID=2835868 RepID=UPI001BDD247D